MVLINWTKDYSWDLFQNLSTITHHCPEQERKEDTEYDGTVCGKMTGEYWLETISFPGCLRLKSYLGLIRFCTLFKKNLLKFHSIIIVCLHTKDFNLNWNSAASKHHTTRFKIYCGFHKRFVGLIQLKNDLYKFGYHECSFKVSENFYDMIFWGFILSRTRTFGWKILRIPIWFLCFWVGTILL